MRLFKKYKYWFIGIGSLLIIMIITFIAITDLLFIDSKKSLYGNRLEGIERVKINDDKITTLKQKLTSKEEVNNVNIYLKGRIINLLIEVKEVDIISSKSLVEIIMTDFNDEEKKYYDYQVFINCKEDEDGLYPIIGYKHKTSNNFVWTNNIVGEDV